MLFYLQVQDQELLWLVGVWVELTLFCVEVENMIQTYEERKKNKMKTSKEKFVEIDGKIKLVNQKIDLIIKNHLHHMKQDIDRILYSLGAIGLLVLGQLLYLLSK